MRVISFEQYFLSTDRRPLIDVRSPGEFVKGHVPGAINLPIFSNEERAEIGTLYKQKSKKAAVMRGLDAAGHKLTWYVKQAQQLINGKSIAIHCWRGGKRSSSMATLLSFMGFDVVLMEGGYKAYRNHILNTFKVQQLNLHILGGRTGSGKTKVLKALEAEGEQIIDLEGLANHKGSAFGAMGELPQPTVEQFENNLFEHFRHLDTYRRVWVENESKNIGRVYVPDGFWQQMTEAVLFEIEPSLEQRISFLIEEYGAFPKEELLASLFNIQKRLGGQHVKRAKTAVEEGQLEIATEIALKYYDKAYDMATSKKTFKERHVIDIQHFDYKNTALQLIELSDKYAY